MALVIVAGVLGVITICGGLFLRRLLGQVAELRRQITRVDRQMRAQRARESFLRALISSDEDGGEDDGDDGPPVQAAIVNGHDLLEGPDFYGAGPPVRRKKHLGLYLGGAAAALTTLGHLTLEALRQHRGRIAAAITGASITAATATLVTVQPWTQDTSQQPPSSAPTVAPTTYLPPYSTRPPATTRAPSTAPTPSTGSTPASAEASPTALLSPSPTGTVISVGDASPPGWTDAPPGGSASQPGDASSWPAPTDKGSTPGASPPPPSQEPAGESPPAQTAAPGACVAAAVGPVISTDVCLLGG
ncbi:hypothetical protein ACIRJO_02575 [Streptomyces sp. NPDC102394]|uniref:hypothetical protein n=1 Tax=Streptomyces sp. NPDC102394 TaxID=3366167 RepID=UPI0038017CA1